MKIKLLCVALIRHRKKMLHFNCINAKNTNTIGRSTLLVTLPLAEVQSTVISMSVCLFSPCVSEKNCMSKFRKIFCTCSLWPCLVRV